MDFEKTVLQELATIRDKQTDHTIQLALNTQVLDAHHKRTTLLEDRVKPLEESHIFVNKLFKGFAALVALAVGCSALYNYLVK